MMEFILVELSYIKKLAERCNIEERFITFGGGVHEQQKTHFILFGESGDFGRFDSDIVKMHIDNKDVYWFGIKKPDFTFEIDENREEKESDKF
jgi:hypothetical protein